MVGLLLMWLGGGMVLGVLVFRVCRGWGRVMLRM
ncbi:hypothetical protein MHAS44199_25030 [Mycolicibacterium hassiacum DSM 44199]|nr:hypothetical protein [Mycolicibacterium hassiacum DSM 44199]